MDKCIIVTLNSDSTGSFYTGDIVTGTVIFELDKDQKIECIDLDVIGTCKAQWTRAIPTVPYFKVYSEKKKVLYIKMENIFENYTNGKKMKAGIYTYPFHFSLPQDLPSTFKTSVASVIYCIKIRSKPACRVRKIVPFNVLGNVNLNHIEDMLIPCIHEFSKTFRTSDAEFSISIKTFKGIAPRQIMPFKVILTNDKNVIVSKLKATLVQKLRYTVSSGYAEEEKYLCKEEKKLNSNTAAIVFDFNMEIPQIVPSSVYMTETMIDISYIIKFEVVFPFHLNLHDNIPITIASVPLIHYDI